MPTSFPAALDAYNDPAGGAVQGSTSPTHSVHHQNHNDAIEAIERVLGAGVGANYGVMRKIAEVSGTGASSVLEFSSIPSSYRALHLAYTGRSSAAGTGGSNVQLTFETTPTAGAYNWQMILANATNFQGIESLGTTFINAGGAPTEGAATIVAYGEVSLPEYTNTSMFKPVFVFGCSIFDIATTLLQFRNVAGLWESTAAIDRIRLTLSAGNWMAVSRATLWGVPT